MKQTQAGFTLLEILLTMTLFAFIMSLLLSSYIQVQTTQKALDKRIQVSQDIQVVQHLIRDDLTHITCLPQWQHSFIPVENEQTPANIHIFSQEKESVHQDVLAIFTKGNTRIYRHSTMNPLISQIIYYLKQDIVDNQVKLFRKESFYLPIKQQAIVDDLLSKNDYTEETPISNHIVGLRVQAVSRDPDAASDSNGNPIPEDTWDTTKADFPAFLIITLYEKIPYTHKKDQFQILTEKFTVTINQSCTTQSAINKNTANTASPTNTATTNTTTNTTSSTNTTTTTTNEEK